MRKRYRWNKRKFAAHVAELVFGLACAAGLWWLIYLWAMEG